jgi:hypothetical protein
MRGYATLFRQAASKADYAFFAHAGFTQAEQAEGERHQVTLAQLDEALGAAANLTSTR